MAMSGSVEIPRPMKQKRSDQLREAIEEKIAIGEFPPGKRLDEAELLARFGVSRTPLREALIQLDSLGLVEIRPRRGVYVAAVSPQRLIEMFEVMGELVFDIRCPRVWHICEVPRRPLGCRHCGISGHGARPASTRPIYDDAPWRPHIPPTTTPLTLSPARWSEA